MVRSVGRFRIGPKRGPVSLQRNLLALLLAVLGTTTRLCAQQERVGLEDALRLALADNRSVQASALDVQRAAETLKAAKTQRLPSFAVDAEFGMPLMRPYLELGTGVLGNVNGSPFPEEPVRLTSTRTPSVLALSQVQEPLSRQHQIGLEIKALDIGRQIEAEKLRASKQEIANQVRILYAQLVDETDAVTVSQDGVRLFTELERITSVRLSEQTVLRSDLVQVQARLSNAKYQQTIAENALIKDKERLNLLMGRSVDAEFEVDPDSDLSAELPTQAEAVATALRLRPDLKEAQLQIERDDLERRAKKAEYIPDVSLQAAYVNLAGSGLPIGGSGYAEVGLQLRWEPFDWGRKSHEIAEKTAVVTQARLAATEAQSKVRIDVSSALRDVQAATQLLGSAHLDEQAAEESLRVVQAKYGQRAALLDEVLKAQSACAQAHLEVSRARTTIRTNRALLSKAIGEDL